MLKNLSLCKDLIIFPFAGNSYEHEQELRAHPVGMPETDLEDSGYFERLGAKTEKFLENFFTAWGTYCASNPWRVLLFGKLTSIKRNYPNLINFLH